MSKLIVDEIQKNGGDSLTLPSTDATANNQALVGSSAGVLSFSPLAMPAADGAANKPVTTDGSGTLQFGGFAIPAGAGSDGQVLTSTGSAAAWEAVSAPPVPSDNILSVGMVMTSSARDNVYSSQGWTSSGPNSTYYNRLSDASSINQAWNMVMGDGRPEQGSDLSSAANQNFYVNTHGGGYHREIIYAHNKRIGHNMKNYYYHSNSGTSQNYGGITISCLPIRNHAASGSTNVTIKCGRSGGSNYGGTGIVYYTSTYSSGTNYANATGGAWTTLQASSSNQDYVNYTATIPVAAGTTVLVMMTSNHRYYTTYRFKDSHAYWDLDTAFTGDIKCDQRMLHALRTGRSPAAVYNNAYPYEIYTTCASLYGDR